jgi:beta-glucanase (GH16 family)
MQTKTLVLAAVMPLLTPAISTVFAEAVTAPSASVAAVPAFPLVDLKAASVESRFTPTSNEVSVTHSQDASTPGVVVTIQAGKETYPGVHFRAEGSPWDLKRYGHLEARIVNTGSKPVHLGVRVDSKGSNGIASNAEGYTIKPGASVAARVLFGSSYKKAAVPIDTAQVCDVVIFAGKSSEAQSFRIEAIEAGGQPGEMWPQSIRIKPKDGMIFGGDVKLDAEKQIDAKGGAQAVVDGKGLKITFSNVQKGQSVDIKPAAGQWDLREAFQVQAKIKNVGTTPATVYIRAVSKPGPTDKATTSVPLAPGQEGEIVSSFAPAVPWLGIKDSEKTSWNGQPNTGTSFTSDAVGAVNITTDGRGSQSIEVESIRAGVPEAPVLPDWVGKRPPVDGEWSKTFDEEFDGNSIDESKWNIYGNNFWDKRSHFSKNNVIVEGGVAKLRYEKKTGYHNDDPSKKQTDYATGFLDTYGKWVQRYGYFEARMKLTKGPGMWPAFWLMPDRGVAAGPQWKRASTKDGGMEFDILEFLGRWGQYRYNIAMHWNGYDKGHQQTGCTSMYVMPDKEGFITAGLLWLPGVAVYYANGKEILRWETPRISNVQSDIMFTNVTGGWDNDGIDASKMPDDFIVDYVRVWQRKDLASAVDGPQAQGPTASK